MSTCYRHVWQLAWRNTRAMNLGTVFCTFSPRMSATCFAVYESRTREDPLTLKFRLRAAIRR